MKLISEGAVSRAGVVQSSPKATVEEGDVIQITVTTSAETELVAEDIPLDVMFEDDDLIVVNKPVGMVVHPAPGTPSGTLVNALLAHCGDSLSGIGGERRPGIVHRIDKDTSGLLVVAKSDKAHHGLAGQFEKHSVERHYRAITYGVPEIGDPRVLGLRGISAEQGNILRIETMLGRHRTERQKQAVVSSNGRRAVTRVRILEPFGTPAGAALVDCWLETGRTHQIRVHLAYAGHSLIGDQVYGGRRKLSAKSFKPEAVAAVPQFPRQALHAATLGFTHPVRDEVLSFEAPLPEDMSKLIEQLSA